MKNILIAAILSVFGIIPAYADSTPAVTFPPTAQNTFLGDQIAVEIINHGSFAQEYRRGQKQVILSDNVIEAGRLNNLYVAALDASLYQDPRRTGLDYEVGLRLNLHAFVYRYVTLTPGWQSIIGNLEAYPRFVFDFGADKAHAWTCTFNLGFGFGPGSGVSQ